MTLTSTYLRTAALMAVLVALLGIGGLWLGGTSGSLLFGAVGLAINFASYWWSDRIALLAHRARPVEPGELPWLHAILGRLAAGANLPTPPLYLIPSSSPNAFATGRNPRHAAV